MARGERRRRRRWVGWLPEVLVLVLLAAAYVSVEQDLGVRLGITPDPRTEPAEVAPPLTLPSIAPAAAVARPQTASQASPAKVARAVSGLLADPKLGPHVRMAVSDLTSGKLVYSSGSGVVTPASTMKTLTSVASLQSLGPQTRFDTRVVKGRGQRIVLIGGGDPFLASKPQPSGTYPHHADVATLAARTATALKKAGTTTVSLGYDDSLFTGPRFNPRWPASYGPEDVVPQITALWVDEGHAPTFGYVDDPSRAAADTFAAALRAQGVDVVGSPIHQTAPSDATPLSKVTSATVGEIVSRLLLVSDNNAAEIMSHHVGIEEGLGGSFTGGAAGVRKVLTGLGVTLRGDLIYDGSGLSRQDRLDPRTLLDVIQVASSSRHPRLRQLVTGLPVAGFSGSLRNRFDNGAPAARGRVWAKTGTLTGVHGLAGVATDLDGDVLAFVVIADRVGPLDDGYAQEKIDRIAAALGGCSCRARPAA